MNPEKRTKILFVDDEPDIVELTKRYLEKLEENFTVTGVESANDGIKKLEDNGFDVVVSDYEMPKMNGIDFLAFLRNRDNDIPFIIFTGRGHEETAMDALNRGADGYFRKGGDPTQQFGRLAHEIKTVVDKRRAERARREAEELTLSILENAQVGIYIVQDGKFKYVNPQFVKLTGYSEEELIGTNTLTLVHPEERKRVRKNAVAMLKGERFTSYQYRFIRKDGDMREIAEKVASITYKGKRAVVGAIWTLLGKNERRKA